MKKYSLLVIFFPILLVVFVPSSLMAQINVEASFYAGYNTYITGFTNPSPDYLEFLSGRSGLKITSKVDIGNNDIVDEVGVSLFNEDGRQLKSKEDIGNDGNYEWIYYSNYDSNGYINTVEIDENGDGVIDRYHQYDFTDDKVSMRYDGGIDGYDYILNNDGNIKESISVDSSWAGDSSTSFTFDDNAHEFFPVEAIDDNRKITYEFDDIDGKPVLMKEEKVLGGRSDSPALIEYSYDNNGNRIKKEVFDSEGILINIERYHYENENMIREEHESSTAGINYIAEYEYDSKGRAVKKEIDENGDGNIDRVVTTSIETINGVDDSPNGIDDGDNNGGSCFMGVLN